MADPKVLYSDCRACFRMTRHDVVEELVVKIDDSDAFIDEKDSWQIVRCLGCLTISFRHQNEDFMNLEEDESGEVSHSVTVKSYPGVIRGHRSLQGVYYLPPLIRKVYSQTIKALGEQANVLASVGLRACIEAVCNHLELSGSSLEKRIDQLFKAGHVSNGDKKRLHAIRFLGNDAVHEIKEPKPSDLRIALEIVEHLLNTIFILERRARNLETVVETYEDFIKLIEACASKHDNGTSINLLGLLGKQRRLVGQNLDAFESKLKDDLVKGDITVLGLGQVQQAAGKPLQFYEIRTEAAEFEEVPL